MTPDSYEALKREWYRKLRASGFRDIELSDPERNRKAYSLNLPAEVRQANADYYAAAASYLQTAKWESPLEEAVWALHAEGLGVRAIAARLYLSKDYVWRRVALHRVAALARARLRVVSRKGNFGTAPAGVR